MLSNKQFRRRRGATLTGYGLLVGLIAVTVLVAINKVGDSVNSLFALTGNKLEAAATGQSSTSSSGNGSGGGSGGGDTTAPTLLSFTRQSPATSSTGDDTITFRAIFDEPVQDVDASDFEVTGTTTLIDTVSGSGGGTIYDITIADSAAGDNATDGDLADVNGNVGINLAAGQNIKDIASNALPAGEPATDEVYLMVNLGVTGLPRCGATLDAGLGVDGIPSTDDTHPLPADGGPGCETTIGGLIAIYAGKSPDGVDFFIAPCDEGMSLSGSSCTGSRQTKQWDSGSLESITGMPKIFVGDSFNTAGADNGLVNTDFILGVTGGAQPAGAPLFINNGDAADVCRDMGVGWYLPAISEYDIMYANLIGDDDPDHVLSAVATAAGSANSGSTGIWRSSFNLTTSYFSSTQRDPSATNGIFEQRFNTGNQGVTSGSTSLYVRCAHR